MTAVPSTGQPQAFDVEGLAMQIISHAGEGRYKVMAAVEAYGKGDDQSYATLLDEAEEEFTQAHRAQITYLQQQATSSDANTPILLVHAMDILMTAMSERDLVTRLLQAVEARSFSLSPREREG